MSPAPRARPPGPNATDHAPAHEAEARALEQALAGLMDAAARLAVAKGLPYAAVQDLLQRAFVDAASAAAAQAAPGLAPHRRVSRIATATGINRREVTRRVQARAAAGADDGTARRGRSLASEVYAHWRSHTPYRGGGRAGRPKVLPRVGPEPSFETLAQAITRDVHPRSLLDELVRLKLARWNEAEDTVELLGGDGFVPQGDRVKLLELLGDNVGDHLRAAVANVLHEDRRHFEQAVFATGLSAESLAGVRPLVAAQWAALLETLVPHLEARIEADAPQQPQGRLRIGLFSYHEDTEPGEGPR